MYVRPRLKDVCNVVGALTWSCAAYLKLTESGGFEIVKHKEPGAFEIVGKNLRHAVRLALDNAEEYINDRRREISVTREED